jgi:hypothetical protein
MSDWLALIGAVIGFVMVVGSLILLYLGKIDLQSRNVEEALRVQYQKMLDVRIRNPALGLFFVGILSLCASYYFYLHLGVKNAKVRIALETDDPGDAIASFAGNLGSGHPDPGNAFEKDVPSNLHDVDVTITETGYNVWQKTFYLDDIKGAYKARLIKKVDQPQKNPAQIVNPGVKLPPLPSETQN